MNTKRLAFVCNHKDHKVPLRFFALPDDPVPECPTHGRMALQGNNSYMGRPVPSS